MAGFDALFQPLRIGRVLIRNRIMSTAHTSGASEDGKPKARYQAYQEEKARGGIGLTIIGGSTSVAEDSPGADMLHLDASNDEIIPHYRALADRLHAHGTAVFSQLAHMGRRANWDNDRWLPPVSPSAVREPAHRSFPKEMEDWDVRRLVRAFAAAARRVKLGGLDGLELSATHNHLIDQFWSPKTNRRTDHYGGSLENRLRFTLEVIEAIRGEVGTQFPLGLRLSGDEMLDGGLEREDCLRIAEILVTRGGLDFLSVLGGSAENLPSHALIFPGMEMPAAPFLYLASAMRRATGVPIFHAQRIVDPATAARAVADGHIDMAAMTRAHIADPHIARKLQEGRVEDIRPCVGASYCIDRLYSGGQAFCLHNAATGRELSMPHTIQRAGERKRVVVVGGGPGGLEAARVCAERGHKVILFERERASGGQLRIAASLSWRAPLLAITDWLERQVRKLGVACEFGVEAQRLDIEAADPDVVVLATGGTARRNGPVDGIANTTTVWDILLRREPLKGRAILFDDNGGEAALSCAEVMSEAKCEVEFVTADPTPGIRLERTTRPNFLRRLYDRGVKFTCNTRMTSVRVEGNALAARLQNEYNGAQETRIAHDVVVDYGTAPNDGLYFELKPLSRNLGEVDLAALVAGRPQRVENNPAGRFTLFRIGDSVSSRNVHAAIYDALRLCKDI